MFILLKNSFFNKKILRILQTQKNVNGKFIFHSTVFWNDCICLENLPKYCYTRFILISKGVFKPRWNRPI